METKKAEKPSTAKSIFEAVSNGDLADFKNILAQKKINVDSMDENGMTALHHAAFKGNKDMVQLLIDRGADPNVGNHEYNYTALHFGALSGNSEVCKLLMDAGAKAKVPNSMGRTPAQMAAFVGNHHTVATINNFVPRTEIAYYVKQEHRNEPLLFPFLVDPLHKFILGVNMHPVGLALNIQNIPGLFDNALKCSMVLEMLCKKEMTRAGDANEGIAFKYHYLSYLLREIHNIKEKQKPVTEMEKEDKKRELIEMFAKRLLKPAKDGTSLDTMNTFLKDCIREFPYRECTTFHQVVATLTSKDPPLALTVIDCTVNGQRGFMDYIPHCSSCGEEKPEKKCSKCKKVQYCHRECQRLHWFVHKKACNREPGAQVPVPNNTVIDTDELSAELQNLVAG